MKSAPRLSTRGSRPRPVYFIQVSPERKAIEIKRLLDWAARNLAEEVRHG